MSALVPLKDVSRMEILPDGAIAHTTTFAARRRWGPGPWDQEPDKVQWVDRETGFDCLAVRNPQMGNWCGYVGVPPSHRLHGFHYADPFHGERLPIDEVIAVHGGVTFAGGCQEGYPADRGVCHVPAPGRPDNVWWFGFDCAHAGDLVPSMEAFYTEHGLGSDWACFYRSLRFVRSEVARLAAQLADA